MNFTRRDFFKAGAAVGAVSAVGSLLRAAPEAPGPTIRPMARRPNILYIIMEDCGPQYGCYGEPLVRTPHVDRLAAEGVRYANAFCTAPVCSASRSALMTGLYQTYTGSHNHRTWPWRKLALPAPGAHLCDWFRTAGYFTCNLQQAGGRKKGATPRAKLQGARGSGKLDLNFVVTKPRAEDPFDGNDWQQRSADQPFFAHITIQESHKGEGWIVAREKPAAELVAPDRLKLPPYYPDHPVARDEYANYLDAIHLSDGYLGEVLARLEQDGLAENTIVVFSSDHGPLFRGKQFLYDNGLRIPLIIRYPDGRAAGTVDDRLVSGVDLAPTLLGLAGITVPDGATHGLDFTAASSPRRGHIYAARDRMDTAIDRMRAVRTAQFKYIRNFLPAVPYMQFNAYKEKNYPTWNLVKQLHREGKLDPAADLFAAETKPIEELFDLAADPHEVRNLAADPAHLATLKTLRATLDADLAKYDRGTAYEDPVDNHRGYWGRWPGDPEATKPDHTNS